MMWIKSTMQRYPSIGKGIVSGLLLSASDAIAQLAIEKIQFDWKRNAQFLVLGLGWLAPCIQIWYSLLLPKITTRYLSHMKKFNKIVARLIIDTLVFAPVTYTGFYLFKDVFLRKDKQNIDYKAEIRQKFIPTLVIDWIVWAPVNFINFWWVPIPFQGLYVGVFSFFFNVFLSYISNKQLEYEKMLKQQQQEAKKSGHQVAHHKESFQQVVLHKIHPTKIQVIL